MTPTHTQPEPRALGAADRIAIHNTLAEIECRFPLANLPQIAIGLGAANAYVRGDVLLIVMPDGSGLAYEVRQ